MDMKEQETAELKQGQMEEVTGGTLFPNAYSKSEYAEAGIRVVDHLFERDEFWWNGSNIGYTNANVVLLYKMKNGREPSSLEEALLFEKRLHTSKERK